MSSVRVLVSVWVTPVYKHHKNTIRLTIQYKAALTTCKHKYCARLYVVFLDVLYCYDVCKPL